MGIYALENEFESWMISNGRNWSGLFETSEEDRFDFLFSRTEHPSEPLVVRPTIDDLLKIGPGAVVAIYIEHGGGRFETPFITRLDKVEIPYYTYCSSGKAEDHMQLYPPTIFWKYSQHPPHLQPVDRMRFNGEYDTCNADHICAIYDFGKPGYVGQFIDPWKTSTKVENIQEEEFYDMFSSDIKPTESEIRYNEVRRRIHMRVNIKTFTKWVIRNYKRFIPSEKDYVALRMEQCRQYEIDEEKAMMRNDDDWSAPFSDYSNEKIKDVWKPSDGGPGSGLDADTTIDPVRSLTDREIQNDFEINNLYNYSIVSFVSNDEGNISENPLV